MDDTFTEWFTTTLLGVYHSCLGSRVSTPTDVENGWHKYDERKVIGFANLVGTLISSLLPVTAIVALSFVKSLLARLGMVALFTVLFSMALLAVTKARRVEIFACTAA